MRRAVAKRVAFVPVIALSFLPEARRLAKTDVHSDTRTGHFRESALPGLTDAPPTLTLPIARTDDCPRPILRQMNVD